MQTFDDVRPARRGGAHKHARTVASTLRFELKTLSPLNHKTPKGEASGFLQAILYLAPHTSGGGKTLCPHSTEACRTGCLVTAGRNAMPRATGARLRRTKAFLNDRDAFFDELIGELCIMQDAARTEGLKLAIRLNGTSDVRWEMERFEDGRSLFDLFPDARFFDYTRTPFHHRPVPPNWRLTWSLADDPVALAVEHLLAGRNVAAVVPEFVKAAMPPMIRLGDVDVHIVDADLHDLRFLDPSPALVLLKPKGALRRGGTMVRHRLIEDLVTAAGSLA